MKRFLLLAALALCARAEPPSTYQRLQAELPASVAPADATAEQLAAALRAAIKRSPENAIPLVRAAVLMRCRAAAVKDAATNNPSSTPKADVLALMRAAVNAAPDQGAKIVEASIEACGDAAIAAAKIVLAEPAPDDQPDYPGLAPSPFNPPSLVFTPVTPVQDTK